MSCVVKSNSRAGVQMSSLARSHFHLRIYLKPFDIYTAEMSRLKDKQRVNVPLKLANHPTDQTQMQIKRRGKKPKHFERASERGKMHEKIYGLVACATM